MALGSGSSLSELPQNTVLVNSVVTVRKNKCGKQDVQRIYLGRLFSVILLVLFQKKHPLAPFAHTYRWVNDNVGALE